MVTIVFNCSKILSDQYIKLGDKMNQKIKSRALAEAEVIVKTKITIRQLAKKVSVSKSTIHKDVNERLKKIDIKLYNEVQHIFKKHLQTKHLIGGIKTKEKYQKIRNIKTIMVE